MTTPHHNYTDIPKESWLYQALPDSFIPYIKLGRFDRPVGVWLTVVPSFWGLSLGAAYAGEDILALFYPALLFIIGGFAARAAGCIINDIWDRDLDKKVERTAGRPLASGALNIHQALYFLFFMLSIAFAVLIQLPIEAIIIGGIAAPLIILYPLMKRLIYWPQLFLGIVFNLSIPIGWFYMTSDVILLPFIIYLGAIFLTIGYDTIYAFQDIEDDLSTGIKSTAIKFKHHPKLFVATNYAIGFLFIYSALLINICFILPALFHLIWQIWYWIPKDRKNSLVTFKSHVIFQLFLLAGFIIALF